MTPDEWAKAVEKAAERWSSTAKEISLAEWQDAMMSKAHRVGSWGRMTRWQRAKVRISGWRYRIMRGLS